MNSKERLLAAFRCQKPDCVPIAPDVDLIGMRWWSREYTKPWWQVYLYNDPPVYEVYCDANRRLGCDIWNYMFGTRIASQPDAVETLLEQSEECHVVERTTATPFGELRKVTKYPRNSPPWQLERLIKDPVTDWPKVRWVMEQTTVVPEIDPAVSVGDEGIDELVVGVFPDFWVDLRGSTQMVLDLVDAPAFVEEAFAFHSEHALALTRILLAARPDALLIGASASSMSLISPALYARYSLPVVKEICALCKAAGIPSHQHTCGRSAQIVKMNYEHTDLNVMEPVEGPPMGNVDLAWAKREFGDRMCLKGNISTVSLLQATPAVVAEEVRVAIESAAAEGGFVLSTGDSPGSNTPDANIDALVEAGRKYGRYD